MDDILVSIEDLHIWFRIFRGNLKVLNGVNLTVRSGEKLSIVGETGCGKTTTVRSILRILPRQARLKKGKVLFQGKDVHEMTPAALHVLRGKNASMIFQDPTAALNPVFTVGEQLKEVIRFSGDYETATDGEMREAAIKALVEVALPDPERILMNYPFQLSGGMRQRVCIAMALATQRDLIIADEPTTNLDVTIQDQVLKLLKELVEKRGNSLILITHSLGVARETADRVYVMYAGSMVETANTEDLFANPLHPYTKALMSCVPKLTGGGVTEGIPGRIPDYLNPPEGCRFEPRCLFSQERCREEKPEFALAGKDHSVACFLYY